MLSITADHLRLFLHITAAAVWVGGQLTVVGLLPTLRGLGGDAPREVARRFSRVAWPAFAVLVVTGLWNLTEADLDARPTRYLVTLFVKLALVAASGLGAALHAMSRTRISLAVWGAVGLLSGLGALLLGVVLRG